jgi:2-methylisocitrate lyase-like PEP mutase family enzyme
MQTQREKADAFRRLHRPGDPVVLVNVWDAVSARIVEDAGFPAIASTSAGVAWSEGYPDGEQISREEMFVRIRRIAGAVDVPVTADCEAAYGTSIGDAVLTARGAIEAGAIGLNFEDVDVKRGEPLDAELQAERIRAMRRVAGDTGVPLVINARTDAFLAGFGESDQWRLEESIRRGNRFLEAGADCIFVPGVSDQLLITALVKGIRGPVNILAGANTPPVVRLAELGVARISVGGAAMGHALAKFRQAALAVKDTGTFAFLADRLPHAQLDALWGSQP